MTQSRYIAFDMITGSALAHASTASRALDLAANGDEKLGPNFIEIRDCGENGRKIIDCGLTRGEIDTAHPVVFRGAGYSPHLEPVPFGPAKTHHVALWNGPIVGEAETVEKALALIGASLAYNIDFYDAEDGPGVHGYEPDGKGVWIIDPVEKPHNRYFVVQVGYEIFGCGPTEQAAYDDARSNLDPHQPIDEQIEPFESIARYVGTAATGDLVGRKHMTDKGEMTQGEMVLMDRETAIRHGYNIEQYD